MQKNKGFSLMELLVVIALITILATASYPTFVRWRDQNAFDAEKNLFSDLFDEARANAFSEKVCPSGNPTTAWKFVLTETNFSVDCLYFNGTDTGTAIPVEQSTLTVSHPDGAGWSDQPLDIASSPLEVSFFTDETKLPEITHNGSDFSRVKIEFVATNAPTLRKTFCFNRIAEYFFWDNTGTCNF